MESAVAPAHNQGSIHSSIAICDTIVATLVTAKYVGFGLTELLAWMMAAHVAFTD